MFVQGDVNERPMDLGLCKQVGSGDCRQDLGIPSCTFLALAFSLLSVCLSVCRVGSGLPEEPILRAPIRVSSQSVKSKHVFPPSK